MANSKYQPSKGMQFGGLVLLVIGVIFGVGFNEAAGTGLALVGITLFWGGRLLAWWRGRLR